MSAESGHIYFIHADGTNRYKIGLTNNLDRRLKELNGKQSPFENKLLWQIEVDDMRGAESALHKFFADRRVNGEWFEFNESELEAVAHAYKSVQAQFSAPRQRYQPAAAVFDDDHSNNSGCAIVIVAAVVCLGAVLVLSGQTKKTITQPRSTFTNQLANVRETPNGKIVCVLPANKKIQLQGSVDGEWFKTNACPSKSGVIHESVID